METQSIDARQGISQEAKQKSDKMKFAKVCRRVRFPEIMKDEGKRHRGVPLESDQKNNYPISIGRKK